MKFKVGDRVISKKKGTLGYYKVFNKKGTIKYIDSVNCMGVEIDGLEGKGGDKGLFWFWEEELILIKSRSPKYKDGDYVEVKGLGKCKIIGCYDDSYDVNDDVGRYITIPKNWIIGYAKKEEKKNKSITFTPKYQIGDIVKTVDGEEHEIIAISYVHTKHVGNNIYYQLSDSDTISVMEDGLELVRRKNEKKKEILDKTEKRYLYNIIRPFKDKVEYIVKVKLSNEFISIMMRCDHINLPTFKKDTMYKGMKAGKRYTLKELGL